MATDEFETVRLKIINEVNEKFDGILTDLHNKGTEYSRNLAKEVEVMKGNTTKEIDNIWSWSKSKLVSIEQSQKLFYEEIFPKLTNKVVVAVDMARDSATCTAAALKSVERSEGFVKDSRKYILILMSGLFLALLPMSVASIIKLVQDHKNQVETVSYLKQLNKGVKIDGTNDAIVTVKPKKKDRGIDLCFQLSSAHYLAHSGLSRKQRSIRLNTTRSLCKVLLRVPLFVLLCVMPILFKAVFKARQILFGDIPCFILERPQGK